MSQPSRQINTVVLGVSILLLLICVGCATEPKKIPAEQIRERANRAFEDLEREEGHQKAIPRETKREPKKQPSDAIPTEVVEATERERPDWVEGESQRYPSPEYLVAVGYGPDRQSAEDDARSEIAKIFHSRIDSQTRTYQEYLQTTSRGKAVQTESLDIEQISTVSTQKVLSGVRIAEVYQETGPDPIFYALAVLGRNQSSAMLQYRIRELDREIQRLLTEAVAEQDPLIRIKCLKDSIEKHILREAYDVELGVVSQSGQGIPTPIHFSEIERRLEAVLLRDFLIGLSVTGTRADEIMEALVLGMNQQGFSVCEDLSRTDLLVRGTVAIEPFERGTSEWKYVQWRAHFDLVDQRGGAVFGSVNRTGREGHISLSQAEDRAVRTIRKALKTSIVREMARYVFSQRED